MAAALALGACSGGSDSGSVAAPIASPGPSPTPAPIPTPTPAPTPTPSPTPAPSATPTYLAFAEIYTNRVGRDLTLSSGCSGFLLQGQPFETLPVTAFGRGLTLRFVLTPQVWAISGDGVALSFDGRLADVTVGAEEVAYREILPNSVNRFAIERPVAAGNGLVYARLATVSTQVNGGNRRYSCLTGVPTLVADLPVSASGGYPRTVVTGTANVSDGSTAVAHALAGNGTVITTDIAAGRVTIAFTLVGAPGAGAGANIILGSFAAAATIDPTTGNFTAPLTSSDRSVTGTISGRFFGPQGVEIGGVIAGSVAAAGGRPAYAFAGALFGAR